MYDLSDDLETRLRAIKEIATNLQYVDFDKMQDQGDEPKLFWYGELVKEAIKDLETELRELYEEHREEVQSLRSQLPPDPAKEAEKRERDNQIAVAMAESIDKMVPGASAKVKELMEKANGGVQHDTAAD